jgi:hypothetical protein
MLLVFLLACCLRALYEMWSRLNKKMIITYYLTIPPIRLKKIMKHFNRNCQYLGWNLFSYSPLVQNDFDHL